MDFNLIGLERKEYKGDIYPSKYYLHVAEYPYIINVSKGIFEECEKNNLSVVTFPRLDVIAYKGKYYYKFTNGKE